MPYLKRIELMARGRKRASGSWVLGQTVARVALAMMGAALLCGLAWGAVAGGVWLPAGLVQAHPGMAMVGAGVATAAALAAAVALVRRTEATWGRGHEAERAVADRIEHAITTSDCAFAHDVDLGSGNVDHVVLTPAGVWVVETKASGWLDGGRFKEALRQTAGNAQRVRRHLDATGVPIRGALVLANNLESYEADFDWHGEPVRAFGIVSFWRRLQAECAEQCGGGITSKENRGLAGDDARTALVRRVWGMGSTAVD